MALSQLGRAALDKAIATADEMTRIAATSDEKKLAAGVAAIVAKVKALANAQGSVGAAAAIDAAPTLERQMAFNQQYLELRRQMERENRSYTAVSNIMKTKHDTVKNSISNIR